MGVGESAARDKESANIGLDPRGKCWRILPPVPDAATPFRPPIRYRQKEKDPEGSFSILPVAGVEPARYRYQRILSPPRLPIPTHRRVIPH